MIIIFYGTSAELIKMVGIIRRIPRSELYLICSSQHHNGLKKLHKQLDIYPDLDLSRGWFGEDVKNIAQMAAMMAGAHLKFAKNFISIRRFITRHDKEMGTKSVAVVHGDTLTTVVGSYLGRILGLPVAHVEAGLRTHNWRSPFPEELDRRIAAKFARYHFAPSKLAESDLRKENVRGEIINTTYNTAKDAIELSKLFVSEAYKNLNLPKDYCLVLLHRTELIENKSDFEAILKVLHDHASEKTPIVFTEHSTTKEKLEAYGFEHYLQKKGMITIPKQPYFDFMEIVRNAAYIVTDGGGLQEDAYFMGIPAIIHRKTTERDDGLGFNAELSKLDVQAVASFLKNHKDKSEFKRSIENISPSQIVVDTFENNRFFKK